MPLRPPTPFSSHELLLVLTRPPVAVVMPAVVMPVVTVAIAAAAAPGPVTVVTVTAAADFRQFCGRQRLELLPRRDQLLRLA